MDVLGALTHPDSEPFRSIRRDTDISSTIGQSHEGRHLTGYTLPARPARMSIDRTLEQVTMGS